MSRNASLRSRGLLARFVLALGWSGTLLAAVASDALRAEPRDAGAGIAVTVSGEGRAVLLVPGLNSAASTWDETCQALVADGLQCHRAQLPGFAGHPAIDTDAFLDTMADALVAYLRESAPEDPVIVGHSLGGVVAMKIALAAPELPARLVIVDSLPFFAAIQDPAATADSVRPRAEAMRAGMAAVDDAAWAAQTRMAVQGMSTSAERVATLVDWGLASDRDTTAQAMFELMTTDLREAIAAIRQPTLVLGSWAAYAAFGATKASTRAIFESQYAKLDGVRIAMSDSGYHFLMWDDPEWFIAELRGFLAEGDAVAGAD